MKVICFARNEFVPGQYPNGITFIGERGRLFVNRGSIAAEPRSILEEKIGHREVDLYRSDNHYRNFLEGISRRRPTAAPIEEAHRSVTICHLANIAMRLGRKIRWDPQREEIIGDESAGRMLSQPLRSPWYL